ncbi:LOW QUALITY PROTEIN: SH3 domain-containing protein 19-like [Osmerus mordax]|uniref:LOW QUALITY PROTEIN: SH3 domain-containing protein 19-like n=1 Tax=Osmerus mordax TaxID=8014 RepID=UPI00350F15D3
MAEARAEDEEESLREARDPVVRRNPRPNNSSSDRPDRHKPEHRLSQGPLSSIRAVIKRTSSRTTSLSEAPRERRRPEITILSAEPLAATSWFAGASGGLTPPPPPPPAAQIWGPTIPPAVQPPPSYEEVIREKTQEQVPPLTPSRRSVTTTTIATQTDSIPRGSASRSSAPRGSAPRGSAPDLTQSPGDQPSPPRPSFSLRVSAPLSSPGPHTHSSAHTHSEPSTHSQTSTHSSTHTHSQTSTHSSTHTHSQTSTHSSTHTLSEPSTHSSTHTLSEPSTRSVTHTHSCPDLLSDLFSPLSSGNQTDQWEPPTPVAVTTPSDPPPDRPRPRPRPRSKASLRPISCEVKVQTLVRLRDDGQTGSEITNQEVFQGKYLQELLEAFSSDDWGFHGHRSDGSGQSESGEEEEEEEEEEEGEEEEEEGEEGDGDMAALRARIQAFEQQRADSNYGDSNLGNTEAPVVAKRPEPRPRAQKPASPIAPPIAPKPQSKACWENRNPMVDASIPKPSDSPTLTPSSSPAPTLTLTPSPAPTLTPSPAPTLTPSPAPTLTPSPAPTLTPSPAPTLTPSPAPTLTPSPAPTLTPFPAHTLTPAPSAAPTPAPRPPPPRISSIDLPSLPPRPPSQTSSRPQGQCSDPSPGEEHPGWQVVLALPPKPLTGLQSPPSSSSLPKATPPRPAVTHKPSALTSGRRASGDCSPPAPAPKPGLRPPSPASKPGLRPSAPASTPASVPASASTPASKPESPSPDPPLPPRPSGVKQLPLRPPPIRASPGRPPPPQTGPANQTRGQRASRKGPPLPPRPTPGHPLFNSYMKQEQEVLVVLEDTSPAPNESLLDDKELQGSTKVITPLSDQSKPLLDLDYESEHVVDQSEPVCKEKTLSELQPILPDHLSDQKNTTIPAPVSGPRCVARFDFEGADKNELTFSQGDVIALTEVIGQEWGRGQVHGRMGIFPLSFTQVVEELSPSSGKRMVAQTTSELTTETNTPDHDEGEGWEVALFDFPGQTADDLSFLKGALITVTQRVDAAWSRGRLGSREGLYPSAFTHTWTAQPIAGQTMVVGVAQVLFDFSAESEDELSLKAGDLVTGVESVDEEWFIGDASGKRGLVPKNYISLLT